MISVRFLTYNVILMLLGIQSVSRSQYYPFSDHEIFPYPSASVTSFNVENSPNTYFNTRNYQPPYREHQHYYHPLNDPLETSTSYFGTHQAIRNTDTSGSDVEIFRPPADDARSESYRIRYNDRKVKTPQTEAPPQEFNQFDSPDIGVFLHGNGQMDISIRNRNNEVVHILPRPRGRQYSTLDGRNPEQPPETLVVVLQPPTCKSSERIFRKDGRCYQVKSKGPCRSNMVFYEDEDHIHGYCDCAPGHRNVSRPYVWWRPHDSCYLLYDQGPCHYSEWLILDHNGMPQCAPRKCPENTDTNPDEFWFLHRGRCYKVGRYYSQFCKPSERDQKVWFPLGESEPKCLAEMPNPFDGRALLTPVNDLPCRPGHKKMQNGDCKRKARFDYNEY